MEGDKTLAGGMVRLNAIFERILHEHLGEQAADRKEIECICCREWPCVCKEESMNHKKLFPNIHVPEIIEQLVEAGKLIDNSWQYDECPKFWLEDRKINLWIDNQTQADRITPTRYRFEMWQEAEIGDQCVFESEHLIELVHELEKMGVIS